MKRTVLRTLAVLVTTTSFQASCLRAQGIPPVTPDAAPRLLEVDRLGSTPFKTLASAAKIVRPGDTIRVKPGTGPYREILAIRTSGIAEKPIIFDGGGNLITGFEPLAAWEEKDGATTCRLPVFPCVLTYQGERLVQDFATGKFTKYADLNEAKDTLTLRPGIEKTGWEISKRALAVSVSDVSHHIYRNLRASGSTNDGFNLHGTGTDLLFENIEAFHNLDEGFSSHDSIQTVIRGGKFWGNDNGIANSYATKEVVSTTLEDVDLRDNLGFGLVLHDCMASLKNVRSWNNGVVQIYLNNAQVAGDKVVAYTPAFETRIWASYSESKTANVKSPAVVFRNERSTVTGSPITVEKAAAPPN